MEGSPSIVHPPPPTIPVTWSSLPRKRQLLILFFCRLADFLQVMSLQSYAFYQLKSFSLSLPDSTISWQAGIIHAAFPATQFITAVIWGHLADRDWMGRKNALLIGLVGTGISCVGLGFSGSFGEAVGWRLVGGAVNGTVGIIRTMISENVKEKRFIAKALILLPLSFYVAAFVGPVLGGFLSDPVGNYPKLFGAGTVLGGSDGVKWMKTYPYAFPAVVSATLLFLCTVAVFFGLDETLTSRQNSFDFGLYMSKTFVWCLQQLQRYRSQDYELIPSDELPISGLHGTNKDGSDDETKDIEMEISPSSSTIKWIHEPQFTQMSQKLPWKDIWTKSVVFIMITEAFYDLHMGAFTSVLVIFLCSPRSSSTSGTQNQFASGLSFSTQSSGFALSLIGIIGIPVQLILYPLIHKRLGTLHCYQLFAMLFPLVYTITPFLALIPSHSVWLIWMVLILLLIIHTVGRAFTLPATIYLLNNCAPHPSVLGAVHGIGQGVSAAFRTIGSVVGGLFYAWGLELGVVGVACWLTATLPAVIACLLLRWVREGSDHKILIMGRDGSSKT